MSLSVNNLIGFGAKAAAADAGALDALVGVVTGTATGGVINIDISSLGHADGDLGILLRGDDIAEATHTWDADPGDEGPNIEDRNDYSGVHIWSLAAADTTIQSTGYATSHRVTYIFAVFRGYSVPSAINASLRAASGDPDPPSCSCSVGDLIVVMGELDDDNAESGLAAPTGYELVAAKEYGGSAGSTNTIMMAVKIATSTTEDAGAFSTSGDDANDAYSVACSPS